MTLFAGGKITFTVQVSTTQLILLGRRAITAIFLLGNS